MESSVWVTPALSYAHDPRREPHCDVPVQRRTLRLRVDGVLFKVMRPVRSGSGLVCLTAVSALCVLIFYLLCYCWWVICLSELQGLFWTEGCVLVFSGCHSATHWGPHSRH